MNVANKTDAWNQIMSDYDWQWLISYNGEVAFVQFSQDRNLEPNYISEHVNGRISHVDK